MIIKLDIFIQFIVDFLSKYYSIHTKHKIDLYYVPLNLVIKNLNTSLKNIEELIKFNEDFGLEIINNCKETIRIRSNFEKYYNNTSPNQKIEFKSAIELIDKENGRSIINHDVIVEPMINDTNCAQSGYIHIKSVSNFAIIAIKYCHNIDRVLKIFNWKSFEDFIAQILQNFHGLKTITNFRFSMDKKSRNKFIVISKSTKKRQKNFEVDIIALNNLQRFILFIDAKYWKINLDNGAALSTAGNLQKKRAEIFCSEKNAIRKLFESFGMNFQRSELLRIKKKKKTNNNHYWVYPMIVYAGSSLKKINYSGVPLVPFNELSDFLINFDVIKYSFIRYKIQKMQLQTKIDKI
ncbi:MAG: hypothetical protein ACTSWY_00505 [Promethearchaeota archaeon]